MGNNQSSQKIHSINLKVEFNAQLREWIITIFEVRDVHGNLATPPPEFETVMFSAGCWITDRTIIDTGSNEIPQL